MPVHVYVFLLMVCLILCLARLGRHDWLHRRPCSSRGGVKRSTLHRHLLPRCPDDCQACRLASTASSGGGLGPVRPWSEVKSRRGAPKRVNTEGFACPNPQCQYFGTTDALFHALVGDGKHGKAEPIQTFRCQACRTTFTSRRTTPLYRLKTPSQQVAVVLSALAEGLDPSAAERVFGSCQATITRWLTRAGRHAELMHERCFQHLLLPHLQVDEIRTRLRRSTQLLWLWLALDPRTKIVPVLQLGPPTQNMAHTVIHSLRRSLAAFLYSPLHQRWAQSLLLCVDRSFWTLAPDESERPQRAAVAGGARPHLRPGEEKLSAAQAGTGHARDVPGNRARSQSCLTVLRLLRPAQYRVYRAGESDRPSWGSRARTTDLGHVPTGSTAARPFGMVARLLPLCAPP